MQKPTMGRIVLYTEDGETSPAVITRVCAPVRHGDGWTEDNADIFLFPTPRKSGAPFADVRRTDEPTDGCWSWPPRV